MIGSGSVPATDDVPSAELPTDDARVELDLEGVDLDQVTWGVQPVAGRLADRIAGLPAPLPGRPRHPDIQRLDQNPLRPPTLCLQGGQVIGSNRFFQSPLAASWEMVP